MMPTLTSWIFPPALPSTATSGREVIRTRITRLLPGMLLAASLFATTAVVVGHSTSSSVVWFVTGGSAIVIYACLLLCHWRRATMAAWLFVAAIGAFPFLMASAIPVPVVTPLACMLAISAAGLLIAPAAAWVTLGILGTALVIRLPVIGMSWGLVGMLALGTLLLLPSMQLMHRALFRASRLDELADVNVQLAVRADENARLLEQYRAVASGIPVQPVDGKLIPFPRATQAVTSVRKCLTAQLPAEYRQSAQATLEDVQALVAQVGERDGYTAAHSVAVAGYAQAIATEMQLAAEAITLLYQSALIHDVGKIGIAVSVLEKYGRLSDAEWELMQGHTIMGAELIRNIPSLTAMEPLIRWHHERLDGSGYPDGLHAAAIPLLVRILSVADVFEAYTAERPYHSGRSLLEGIYWLQREAEAGRLDAHVVAACERSLRQNGVQQDEETTMLLDIA